MEPASPQGRERLRTTPFWSEGSLYRGTGVGGGKPGGCAGGRAGTRTTLDPKGKEVSPSEPPAQGASSTGIPGRGALELWREPRHAHPHFTLWYSHLVQPNREPEVPELMDATRWVSSRGQKVVGDSGVSPGETLPSRPRGAPTQLQDVLVLLLHCPIVQGSGQSAPKERSLMAGGEDPEEHVQWPFATPR